MRNVFVRKTLLRKIALLYFVMNAVSISMFLLFLNSNQLDLVTENTRFRAKSLISSVLLQVETLDTNDRQALVQTISPVLPQFLLMNVDGEVVGESAVKATPPADRANSIRKALTQAEFSRSRYYLDLNSSKFRLQFYIPLQEYGFENLILYTPISMTELGNRFKQLRQLLIVGVIVLTILHLIFALILSQMIVVPIRLLARATKRVAGGNFEQKVKIKSQDEIGALGRGFNKMQDMLRLSFKKINEEKLQIEKMAVTDELTQIFNRRFLFNWVQKETTRLDRYAEINLGLLMLDIDHFKRINDTHGHEAGDIALKHVANIFREQSRQSDVVARYGGEEFVILLPSTDLAGSLHYAEQIRQTLESTPCVVNQDTSLELTISIGVSEYQFIKKRFERVSVSEFLKSADASLYKAKKGGRNMVYSIENLLKKIN